MFKKLKDKLAEEVKSSPQRIQQFAQAAQAAVTSASSSISDITNTDLFTIGDNDNQQSRKAEMSPITQKNTFQDVPLVQPTSMQTSTETVEYDNQRQRRLSNSSFASDVSFRLPSYDSPSMYHLQSDMEVSASEAEERAFSGGTVSLDRVTKEQIYAAYRRTQERYTKYRTQYADLARHYKLLERENAKARSVLVETQDKALRRISELREQCSLEQSAKAHLEKALRIDIEERNLKIDTLNTKLQFLQSYNNSNLDDDINKNESNAQLINLSTDEENKPTNDESSKSEIFALNTKVEKLEQLVNKYKDSLKITKEKNAQLTTELQILSNELRSKSEEHEQLKVTSVYLNEAKEKIQELNDVNEELQNKINSYDFSKTKEISSLEIDLQKAQEEIIQLSSKIEVFTKREEENAISLAENKLSIHKELESKENEIKSLKDSLSASRKEIQSLNIVVSDYKNSVSLLEEERSKHTNDINELKIHKSKIAELESQVEGLTQKCQSLEIAKAKAEEEFKCLQLQLKQETAEKLAMIDRNNYLENRNTQLSEENTKKSLQINNLDSELLNYKKDTTSTDVSEAYKNKMIDEIELWKSKYRNLESEIQEEREELVKLQSEIEKLLANHELVQLNNSELHNMLSELKSENATLQGKVINSIKIKTDCESMLHKVRDMQQTIYLTSEEMKSLIGMYNDVIPVIKEKMSICLENASAVNELESIKVAYEELRDNYCKSQSELEKMTEEYVKSSNALNLLYKQNETISAEIQTRELENVNLMEQVKLLNNKYETALDELQSINKDKHKLAERAENFENKYLNLQATIDSEQDQKSNYVRKAETLEQENSNINKKYKTVEDEKILLTKEIDILKKEHEEIITTCSNLKKENEELKIKTSHIEDDKLYINKLEENIQIITQENMSLKSQSDKMANNLQNLEYEISEVRKSYADMEIEKDRLSSILETLKAEIHTRESEKVSLMEQIKLLSSKYEVTLDELQSLNNDKQKLTERAENFENKYQNLQATINSEEDQKSTIILKVETLEQENNNLNKKIKAIEDEKLLLTEETYILKKEHEEIITTCSNLNKENQELIDKTSSIDGDKLYIKKLEENMQTVTQENISLKKQAEKIANSLQDLEFEISEVRKSHAEIEIEKDRISSILEKLEKEKDKFNATINKDTQTDELNPIQKLDTCLENEISLSDEYNSQKEENRRLQSDIAGLQTYLAKISKENSVLNDKLRELIASSENSPHKNDTLSSDMTNLKHEIQLGKEKIDELLRENTLLIDENLELKDQVNTQNYSPVATIPTKNDKKEIEFNNLKEKYNNLLDTKHKLEKRLNDLEQMNNSVNENMILTQELNEKLRLSNEKLERRLDEALVSLRHLHSLQENTELEYLRNILYEYLTGSGTHSLTLAKVLAAVVKFDDMQTQQVLHKEKERQGFLRQLGLL